MLPALSRAVCAPVSRRCASTLLAPACVRLASTNSSYKASANAAATQPINTQKPVKEVKGVNITDYSTGAEDSDATLGATTKAPKTGAFTDLRVSDVLKRKEKFGTALHTVRASDTVQTAMGAMNEFNIGAILVTDDRDLSKIVGILSTRDFIRHVADEGVDPRKSKVADMMSKEPVFTYSDAPAIQSLTLMTNGGFRHLPVRDRSSNRTVGLISVGDLVRSMMNEFKQKGQFLEDLVAGKYPA